MERDIQTRLDELNAKQKELVKEYEHQNAALTGEFAQLLMSEMQRQGLDELMLHQMRSTGAIVGSWDDDCEFDCDIEDEDIESVDYQIQEISYGAPKETSYDTITYNIVSRFGIRDDQLMFHPTSYSSTNMGDLNLGGIAKENWQEDWLPISEFGQDRKLQNLLKKCLNTPEIWEFTKKHPECNFLHRELTSETIQENIERCNEDKNFCDAFLKWAKLEHIDLSKLNTSVADSLQAMFYHCSHLKSVDVSVLDTRNCHNFESMFDGCTELHEIKFGGKFTTEKAQTMREMFRECKALTSLDLSSFRTSKCEQMEMMFMGCSSLVAIDLRTFDARKVNTVEKMFKGCTNLESIAFYNFNAIKCTNANEMFSGCTRLKEIDLKGLSTSKSCDVKNMFYGCSNLTHICFNETSIKPYSAEGMFGNCRSIEYIDLSCLDTSNMQFIDGIFSGCENLNVLDLSNWSLNKVSVIRDMFNGCSKLSKIVLKNAPEGTIKFIKGQLRIANLSHVEIITE